MSRNCIKIKMDLSKEFGKRKTEAKTNDVCGLELVCHVRNRCHCSLELICLVALSWCVTFYNRCHCGLELVCLVIA